MYSAGPPHSVKDEFNDPVETNLLGSSFSRALSSSFVVVVEDEINDPMKIL